MPGRTYRDSPHRRDTGGISPWWLAIVALFTYALGSSYFPEAVHGISPATSYALGLASVLLLFASILAHEFGHAIVARRHGIEVEEIDLWLLGGVSRMPREAHEPGDELRYALARPAITAVIAACFGVATLLLPPSTPPVVSTLVDYQAYVNAAIFVLNMLPAFPLDGGRMRHGACSGAAAARSGPPADGAAVGRGFGYVMIGLGLLELLAALRRAVAVADRSFHRRGRGAAGRRRRAPSCSVGRARRRADVQVRS